MSAPEPRDIIAGCCGWPALPDTDLADDILEALTAAGYTIAPPGKFKRGDRVTKVSGSSWTGRVVGTYSTTLTPEGYAVESENEPGSVQIYPAAAQWHDAMQNDRLAAQYGFRLKDKAKAPHGVETMEYAGFEFHAMLSFMDFFDDGKEQRHCVASRFGGALAGSRFYFSMRSKGKRVATVEYDAHGAVLEMKGFANAKPSMNAHMAGVAFGEIVRDGPPKAIEVIKEAPVPTRLRLPFHWPKKTARLINETAVSTTAKFVGSSPQA